MSDQSIIYLIFKNLNGDFTVIFFLDKFSISFFKSVEGVNSFCIEPN